MRGFDEGEPALVTDLADRNAGRRITGPSEADRRRQ
jgi:hypothetical protein